MKLALWVFAAGNLVMLIFDLHGRPLHSASHDTHVSFGSRLNLSLNETVSHMIVCVAPVILITTIEVLRAP